MFRGCDDTKSNGIPQELNRQQKKLDGLPGDGTKKAGPAGPADDADDCAGQPSLSR
jgi:hypothetical protein